MKIQHYAIVFIIIILPFSIICKSRINNKIDVLNNETRINNAIDTATIDAIDTLIELNNEFYALYEGQTMDVTPGRAREGIKTFFQTLSLNNNLPFIAGAEGEEFAESYFAPYIPAILVIAFDGFYIYSVENTSTGYKYVLSPKIPYAYEEGDYYINFSLGNYIKLYTRTGMLYEGEYKYDYIDNPKVVAEYGQLKSIFSSSSDVVQYLPQLTTDMSLIMYALCENGSTNLPNFLKTKSGDGNPIRNDYAPYRPYDEVSEFHKKRREVIIDIIVETLNEKINNHNRYADIMGINYDFFLPDIKDAQWINSINDISIMAFVQGIPTGYETYYNSYALGASRIIRKDWLYGTELPSGVKLYHGANCEEIVHLIDIDGYPISSEIKEIFSTPEDALLHGYSPCLKRKNVTFKKADPTP